MVDRSLVTDKADVQETDNSARLSERIWSQMPIKLQRDQGYVQEQEFLDFSQRDPVLVAQAEAEVEKKVEPEGKALEDIGSWTKTHALHGSQRDFANRDDAVIAAFKENRLEERSQAREKEYGFWTYPSFDKSGKIEAWHYTEPFESTSKKDTVITQQDWMSHPFPASADKIPGQVGQGHTHPHKRPPG